jgi:hypothetical protein
LKKLSVDREDSGELESFLKTLVKDQTVYFDLVVDFTAYHKEDMEVFICVCILFLCCVLFLKFLFYFFHYFILHYFSLW